MLHRGSIVQSGTHGFAFTMDDSSDGVAVVTVPRSMLPPESMSEPTVGQPADSAPPTRERHARQAQPSGRSGYYGTMQSHAETLSVSEEQLDDWLQGRTDE